MITISSYEELSLGDWKSKARPWTYSHAVNRPPRHPIIHQIRALQAKFDHVFQLWTGILESVAGYSGARGPPPVLALPRLNLILPRRRISWLYRCELCRSTDYLMRHSSLGVVQLLSNLSKPAVR